MDHVKASAINLYDKRTQAFWQLPTKSNAAAAAPERLAASRSGVVTACTLCDVRRAGLPCWRDI